MDNIYFPSYKRWEKVRAYEYLGCGHIVVPKSQEKDYRKRYSDLIVIPDELDGSISKKRNAVLDLIQERESDGYGWIIDDDFVNLKRKKENKSMSGEECLEHLERVYIMAKDCGATYAGFDYSGDNLKLKDFQPFSFTKTVFGMALINANDGIRYDQSIRVNEDVEFWLQKINQSRFILRDNQYVSLFYGKDGANNSVIGYDKQEQLKYAKQINKKWGGRFMVWNKNRFEFKIPIKGA